MDGCNLGYEYHGLGRGCLYFAALDCIAVRTKFRAAARMMLISAMGAKADISVPRYCSSGCLGSAKNLDVRLTL